MEMESFNPLSCGQCFSTLAEVTKEPSKFQSAVMRPVLQHPYPVQPTARKGFPHVGSQPEVLSRLLRKEQSLNISQFPFHHLSLLPFRT